VLRQAQACYREALVLAKGADNRRYYDPLRGSGAVRQDVTSYTLDRTGWG
jgi:hypothetical protein